MKKNLKKIIKNILSFSLVIVLCLLLAFVGIAFLPCYIISILFPCIIVPYLNIVMIIVALIVLILSE